MVRTRGGGSSQTGRDEEHVERRRPTASARRERVGVAINEEAPAQAAEAPAQAAEAPAQAPEARVHAAEALVEAAEAGAEAQVEAPADDGDGFPGGPRDTFILLSYAEHVAYQLWTGEVFDIVFMIDKFMNLTLCMVVEKFVIYVYLLLVCLFIGSRGA